MKLTVLGAGTCVPYPGLSPSGYLVQIGTQSILMDAGPGTITRLAAQGLSYKELDFVLISHLHPDHVLDLFTLLQANNATPGWTRRQKLTLLGCPGIESFLRRQFRLLDGTEPENYLLEIHELGAQPLSFDGWSLTAAPSHHTPVSQAYRISDGKKSLVYSGDVSNPLALVELARQADLFVCECSLPQEWNSPDHLGPAQVGALAEKAGVHKLLITHRYPPALEIDLEAEVRKFYHGETALAVDGWSIVL